jgi:hypothetical protein
MKLQEIHRYKYNRRNECAGNDEMRRTKRHHHDLSDSGTTDDPQAARIYGADPSTAHASLTNQ